MDIYEFDKNSVEKVRVSLAEYRGHKLVDIRVYYKNDDNEFLPSRKGISLPLDLFPELWKGLEKARKRIESENK